MDERVHSQLYDGGTIIGEDGRPVRRFRRVNRHETRWRNEATGEEIEQVIPSEDLLLYELRTY